MFGTSPHWSPSPMVVGAVTWTDELAPAARLPEKLRTLPTRLQPGSEDSIDHVKSLSSVSETVTPKAVPAPLFWIVIVNPIGLPIRTGSTWSASLSMPSSGQSTTIVALSVLLPVICGSFDSFDRVDGHGVDERTAVVEVRVAGDRDRDLAVGGEVTQVRAAQGDAADRAEGVGVGDGDAVEGDRIEVPGDAARQGVGEADVIRRAVADVGDDDGELGDFAGADRVICRPS